MKKKLLSVISILCVLCLLMPPAYAGDVTQIESTLQSNIRELEDYLNAKQSDMKRLEALSDKFEHTNGQRAKLMSMYCKALLHMEQENYKLARSEVAVLLKTEIFTEYLRELKSDFILDLEVLDQYITGREAENKGDAAAAVTAYSEAIGFFDAMERGQSINDKEWKEQYDLAQLYIERGKYNKAVIILTRLSEVGYMASEAYLEVAKMLLAEQLEQLAAEPTPVSTPEPTPVPTVAPTPVPTAAPVETPTEAPAKKKAEATAEPTAEHKHSYGPWENYSATQQRRVCSCGAAYFRDKPTQESTQTPEHKHTYGAWQYYSPTEDKRVCSGCGGVYFRPAEAFGAWSVNKPSIYIQIQEATQYMYRVKSMSVVYGDWTDWTEQAVSASDTLEVETKSENKTVTSYVYKYSKYYYENSDHKGVQWHSCVNTSGQSYFVQNSSKRVGWDYTSSTTPFTNNGVKGGCTNYKSPGGETWYNESKTEKSETVPTTMYRSRTKSSMVEWSDWSGWSFDSAVASDKVEVQTRTVYRSR